MTLTHFFTFSIQFIKFLFLLVWFIQQEVNVEKVKQICDVSKNIYFDKATFLNDIS